MTECKESARREGVIIDNEIDLYARFTKLVQQNLHIVFTMNPANSDFNNRCVYVCVCMCIYV